MNHFELNEDFYNEPLRIGDVEPQIVIKNFFGAFTLSEVRMHLWNLVQTAVTTDNHEYQDASERDGLLSFYNQVEELIEAAYMVSDQKLRKSE